MEPWQRDNMRHARLELHVKDIGNAERLPHWEELCGLWSDGPRTLRLKIELETGYFAGSKRTGTSGPTRQCYFRESGSGGSAAVPPGWSCEPYQWIDEGLRQLRGLRRLEVELAAFPLNNDQKLAWCRALDERHELW